MKKDGGKIKNWQIHNLQYDEDFVLHILKRFPNIITDPNLMIVTGITVDEPTGRWKPGDHFVSSYIVKIDREKNTIETLNTIYHFDPETEGKDILPDLGNNITSVFYD